MATDPRDSNGSGNENSGSNNSNQTIPTREIPVVPPTDRVNLNETIVEVETKLEIFKSGGL